jgi:hypothetical protein
LVLLTVNTAASAVATAKRRTMIAGKRSIAASLDWRRRVFGNRLDTPDESR